MVRTGLGKGWGRTGCNLFLLIDIPPPGNLFCKGNDEFSVIVFHV